MSADSDFGSPQRQRRIGKIMRPGAEIRFLRHRRALVDLDRAQAVGVRSVPQAGSMMQRQLPRQLDPRPLMHKGPTLQFRPKQTKDQ